MSDFFLVLSGSTTKGATTVTSQTSGTGSSVTSSIQTTSISSTSGTSTHTNICVKIEAMNPQNGVVDETYLQPSISAHVEDLVPGRAGVDFPEGVLYPNVTITFARLGRLFFIQVPPESDSNVRQIAVDFYDVNRKLITTLASPTDSPILQNTVGVDDVFEIVIHLMGTTDGKSPKKVTIDVIGCFFECRSFS